MSRKICRPKTNKKLSGRRPRLIALYDPPVKIIEKYIKSGKTQWNAASTVSFRQRIYHFYRWLERTDKVLAEISIADLEGYDDYLKRGGINGSSFTQYRITINAFLRWLAAKNYLKFSSIDLKLEKPKYSLLTLHAKEIMKPHCNKIHRIYVYEFYEWLSKNQSSIDAVAKTHLKDYEKYLRAMKPSRSVATRQIMMRMVHNHLRWLCNKAYLKKSIAELGISKGKLTAFSREGELPPPAQKFLQLATAHKRPNTVATYRTRLGHFYNFLHTRQISIDDFTRLNFEEYMKSMHDAAYASQTRRHAITSVQTYLSWLYECGFLKKDPEPIIRNFPRPKRADYLPRNLLPEVDHLLQDQLEEADEVVSLALLFMRRTGLRIGDLQHLLFDCLRLDPEGNTYLKVPVGKLHNERLVPLDKITLGILKRIKEKSLRNNSGEEPEFLVIHPRGRPPNIRDYHLVLYKIGENLRLDDNQSLGEESLVSHRLRHTYATTLLSAGMSIEGIKELLGHRSLNMTLRYAQVTPRKLTNDYLIALKGIEDNVEVPIIPTEMIDLPLKNSFNDLLAQLRGKLRDQTSDKKKVCALIRRIERLREELIQLN